MESQGLDIICHITGADRNHLHLWSVFTQQDLHTLSATKSSKTGKNIKTSYMFKIVYARQHNENKILKKLHGLLAFRFKEALLQAPEQQ